MVVLSFKIMVVFSFKLMVVLSLKIIVVFRLKLMVIFKFNFLLFITEVCVGWSRLQNRLAGAERDGTEAALPRQALTPQPRGH